MKIKIFQSLNLNEAEKMVNEFETTHQVKATQSHISVLNGLLVYTFVVFYVE